MAEPQPRAPRADLQEWMGRSRWLPLVTAGGGKPEENLWLAVLMQAVQDLVDPEPGADVRELAEWFASESLLRGSYLWACERLDIDPSILREGLVDAGHLLPAGSTWRM